MRGPPAPFVLIESREVPGAIMAIDNGATSRTRPSEAIQFGAGPTSGGDSAAVGLTEAYRWFLCGCPQFAKTTVIDEVRAREFSRLDRQRQVYLDYTGGGLYSEGQVRRHSSLLLDSVLGNPHSSNPTSALTSQMVEKCRRRLLSFFNAREDEYAVIFTANASHALKLVGESYPFQPGDQFLLTFDNHNSVNGIREFDRAKGAQTAYVPVSPPELRVDERVLDEHLERGRQGGNNLFAYPAQSNFSGVQHPLEWIKRAQDRGWDVLLDVAAFVPTNRLDFSRWHPDFAALSFYKIFGYPTGVGALIARRQALAKLHRPWFAGGTITVASVQADRFFPAAGGAAFEDGTLDYANLPAVEFGLDFVEWIGIDLIHERVRCLTGWLIERLLDLRHQNGRGLVLLYGPPDTEARGGTVTFNLQDCDGRIIDHQLIENQANQWNISLRTGCFCNPGAGELALGLSRNELSECFTRNQVEMTYDDLRACVSGKGSGAVRVSLGMVSNFADVHRFLEFASTFREWR